MKHSIKIVVITIGILLASTQSMGHSCVVKASTSTAKKALIFGITGQDGSYLAELLLEKGYIVHGARRRTSLISNTSRIDHICSQNLKTQLLFLHYGDITDTSSVINLIKIVQPDEIYNLAAQSHVRVSFDMPEYTSDCDAMGTLRILEAIRILGMADKVRFYQASTSELYGKVMEIPQSETTPFYPRSPYGVAKLYAFWITKNYREAYGIYACNGILFNHESPRRGKTFVTRKITQAVSRIAHGLQDTLHLGNLDAKRDWGYAKDYVEGMWLMLQQDEPEDFVIATGKAYSVREFVERSFAYIGKTITWRGSGIDEVGYDKESGKELVYVDPLYFRPAEVEFLLGDPTYAKEQLNWQPATPFEQLVDLMMEHDLAQTGK